MYTEIEVWNLFWLASLSNGVWFAGLAFLLWVSFRAANMAGESENLISKIVVTAFCLLIVFQINFNGGAVEWAGNGTATALASLQASGTEISQGAQNFIANAEPGKEFNLIPNLVGGIFIVVVLIMQLTSIWKK